jgi:hypothetical protein
MGLNASGADVVTTTYGYDAFGARVLQIGTSTTTLYPFKWYSIASSTATGAKYSTTTEYVWNGDYGLEDAADNCTVREHVESSPKQFVGRFGGCYPKPTGGVCRANKARATMSTLQTVAAIPAFMAGSNRTLRSRNELAIGLA